MKIITTADGYEVKVDDHWFGLLSAVSWRTSKNRAGRYVYRTGPQTGKIRKTILMHRVITSAPNGLVVDHINHDSLDNQEGNLRICTVAENSRNMRMRHSESGLTGIARQGEKWHVKIRKNYKRIFIGAFENLQDAIQARRDAEVRYFGEYAPRFVPDTSITEVAK